MTSSPTPARPLAIAVIGAGGKMGMRISDNLQRSEHDVSYCETSPSGQERIRAAGRDVVPADAAVADADCVILAVPDVALGTVSQAIVRVVKSGAMILTLDPAAAYAGVLEQRSDLSYAVAHPCHPSVFLERTTPEEYADTFGGVAAPQHVVAALDKDDVELRERARDVIATMYAPVIDVHWVSVRDLAVLEPTLVETVACMISKLLKDALHETVHTLGVPEAAAQAMLFGHIQVALTNSLRGSNPFSDACLIAMDYGRSTIVRDDWRKIFATEELDAVIAKMLRLEPSAAG